MTVPGADLSAHAEAPSPAEGRWVVDQRPRAVRLRGPLAVAGLAGLTLGWMLVFDPNEPGHFPACPLKSATGLDCPACGGLRATRAVLGGDLATAWDRNALAVLMLPVIAVAWLVWLRRAWTGRTPVPGPRRARTTRAVFLVVLLLVLAWSVWRNLPVGSYWSSELGG